MKKSKKYILIIFLGFLIFVIAIFFIKNNYKKTNHGNNITNKTLDEVEEYILNINSYKATIEVTVNSNKNVNKYKLIQIHSKDEDIQEAIEPENIKGIKFIYQNNTLKIQNTKLNLEKIYSNYQYLQDNYLWLSAFIEDYKSEGIEKEINDNNEEVIITIKLNDNTTIKYKRLYIDKKTGKPIKLYMMDNNKNKVIYILYNEIEINY